VPGRFRLDPGPSRATDPDTQVTAQLLNRGGFRDLSVLGSGTLQVIEVLLSLYAAPGDLHLVLLDEPDSHIHRDIQRRLFARLEAADQVQVFLTTHNESLLRAAPWEQVFHLADEPARPDTVVRPHRGEPTRARAPRLPRHPRCPRSSPPSAPRPPSTCSARWSPTTCCSSRDPTTPD
jgi:hypothetical protein